MIKEHGSKTDTCYVVTMQGPRSVWATWSRGSYPQASAHVDLFTQAIKARGLRWGAYGDPAAIPVHIIRKWSQAGRWTGYTHQWRKRPSLRSHLMASVDSISEGLEARAKGWRTFRVEHDRATDISELVGTSEILCPASDEAGKLTSCDKCGLCNGTSGSVPHNPHKNASKIQGLELWRGPSRLNGEPIVVLVTGLKNPSENAKTGPRQKAWILAQKEAPHTAQARGADEECCGDCPMRPIRSKPK